MLTHLDKSPTLLKDFVNSSLFSIMKNRLPVEVILGHDLESPGCRFLLWGQTRAEILLKLVSQQL